MSTVHPTQDVLLAFLRDELPPAEANTVSMHLDACETCVTSLEQLPAHRQLGQLLAASPAADIAADVQAVSPLLDHLKTLRPTFGETASEPTIGFLEPSASPGDLGRLGRYRVLAELGAGGMGRVFKAQHPVMERIVALKVISPRRMSDPASVARFQREVKAVARLQHPNIVAAYDADQAAGVHFLVMEYVDGVTLAELLRKRKRLSVREAARVIRQAALGLQYAHEQGMVHRDLKPSNLMVTRKGTVKIMDLGLARIVSDAAAEPSLTSDRTTLGTPDYMAPEQARDAHSADARSDIYSLGATLYHLLAGQVPYPDGSAFERLMARQTRDPQPLSKIAPQVPPELAAVVAKMMCRDPNCRYQTPVEVALALLPFARTGAGEQVRAEANPAETEAPPASPPDETAEVATDLAALAVDEQAARLLPRPSRAAVTARSKVWRNPTVLAAMAVAGVLFIALTIFGLQLVYPEGTLVIEVNQPGASVKVDGRELDFIGIDGKLTAKLPQGEHKLLVTKDGFETKTEEFSIRRGEQTPLRVTLIRIPKQQSLAIEPTPQPIPGLPTPPSPSPADSLQRESIPTDRLAAAGGGDPSDAPTELVAVLAGDDGPVWSVAVSQDGRYIVSGGHGGAMRLWDIATGKLVRRFEGHTGTVTSVAISPDGRWVISGSGDDDEPFDNTARIWDVATGQLRHRFDMGRLCVFDVGFSADSQQAIAGANNCRTYVWDIEGRREIQLYAEGVGAVLSVAFTPDGKHAISGHADNLLRIWDLATGKQSFCSQPAETGGWVWSIGVAPNGQYAYTGASGTVQEWGISAKPCKNRSFYVLHDVDKRVCAIALNSDGKTLATSGHDSRVILWDAATGKPLRQWKFPHQEKPAEPWIPPGAVNDGLAKCTETILKKSARRSLRAKRTPTRPSDEVCRRPHAAAPRTLRWRDSSRHCRSSVISPC